MSSFVFWRMLLLPRALGILCSLPKSLTSGKVHFSGIAWHDGMASECTLALTLILRKWLVARRSTLRWGTE